MHRGLLCAGRERNSEAESLAILKTGRSALMIIGLKSNLV